jgi:DNA-binding NtrC family response regulator
MKDFQMTGIADIRCLVIEDDDDDFELVQDIFADIDDASYEISRAQDYDQAANILSSTDLDVCLVDFLIGARNGLDFIRTTRLQGEHLPMILLTGLDDPSIDQDASKAGANDFISKADLTPAILERSIRYSLTHANQLRSLDERANSLKTILTTMVRPK